MDHRLTQHFGPGQSARRAGADVGFSLIELVIVVTVVALLSVSVTIGVGNSVAGGGRGALRDAQSLRDAVAQARDIAILSGQTTGVHVVPAGWEIWHRTANGWQPLGPRGSTGSAEWTRTLANGDQPVLPGESAPVLLLLSDGRATPFSVRFGTRGNTTSGRPDTVQVCTTDGWRALECRAE